MQPTLGKCPARQFFARGRSGRTTQRDLLLVLLVVKDSLWVTLDSDIKAGIEELLGCGRGECGAMLVRLHLAPQVERLLVLCRGHLERVGGDLLAESWGNSQGAASVVLSLLRTAKKKWSVEGDEGGRRLFKEGDG